MKRWVKRAAVAILAVAILAVISIAFNHNRYPYGPSHCCDKAIMLALMTYADEHDGWFPRGEATPEASLSLLFRQESSLTCALPGKTVPESVVKERLESGQLLTPETCGWHYVEGLRRDDDPGLGLFWDKAGLGHNGERLSRGGHFVCFVGLEIRYIPGDRWNQFIADQEQLHQQLKRP